MSTPEPGLQMATTRDPRNPHAPKFNECPGRSFPNSRESLRAIPALARANSRETGFSGPRLGKYLEALNHGISKKITFFQDKNGNDEKSNYALAKSRL